MPSRKKISRRKRPVIKRLLDDVLPKKSPQSKATVVIDLVTDNSQSQSSNDVVTSSSSMLKRYEEVMEKKDQGTSPDPTLPTQQGSPSSQQQQQQQQQEDRHSQEKAREPVSANNDFFYSPMYRRYFGITPPNPRLYNPRLLEDYIDWYINVYIEEEVLWQYLNTGNPADRDKRDEQEALEEAKRLACSSSSTSKQTP